MSSLFSSPPKPPKPVAPVSTVVDPKVEDKARQEAKSKAVLARARGGGLRSTMLASMANKGQETLGS